MSGASKPTVVVLGGINGAGKTTASQRVLRDAIGIPCFVNADTIARGLNAFDPESEAVKAGCTTLGALKKNTKCATSCGGCGPLAKSILDAQLKKQGVALTNHLCEHFAHSRQALFHLAKATMAPTSPYGSRRYFPQWNCV